MSKHVSRKSIWTKVSPIEHRSFMGFVRKNPEGLWDAYVEYQKRPALTTLNAGKREWYKAKRHAGETKRAREAQDRVKALYDILKVQHNEDVIL